MRAYVLITVEGALVDKVLKSIRSLGIEQVDQVAQTYDIVAVIEGEDPKQIGELIITGVQRTDGVIGTVTLLQRNE